MNETETAPRKKPAKKFYMKAPLSLVHLRVYLAIILGQFTCGYTIQISGAAISEAQNFLSISSLWVGLIGAGTLLGLAGSLIIGKISDVIGRRRLLLTDMYLLAVISVLQLLTASMGWTFVMRVLAGLMMAVEYTAGNTLLIEWLPMRESSRLQSHLIIYWVLGFLVAYVCGGWMTGSPHSWQWMMVSAVVPALLTAVFRSVSKLPSSPSWLVNQGQPKAAQKVINKNLGHKFGLSHAQRHQTSDPDEKISWTVLFSAHYIRQTLIGGVFYAAQAFAFFGISIFLPLLLKQLGFGDSNFAGYLYNGSMLVGVLLGTMIFNRFTRRSFLVGTFALSALLLLVLALWHSMPSNWSLVVFALASVVMSAALVIENPYMSELFDSTVRGTGVGLVVTLSRIGAAAGTLLLPIITASAGVHMAMLVCGVILGAAGLICLLFAPETKRSAAKAAAK